MFTAHAHPYFRKWALYPLVEEYEFLRLGKPSEYKKQRLSEMYDKVFVHDNRRNIGAPFICSETSAFQNTKWVTNLPLHLALCEYQANVAAYNKAQQELDSLSGETNGIGIRARLAGLDQHLQEMDDWVSVSDTRERRPE